MNLDAVDQALIRAAAGPDAITIHVEPLDKGLSGATVWLTEWSMQYGIKSAPHVLKLDRFSKLKEEKERLDRYVSPVDPETGHITLFGETDSKGLLRQGYIGSGATGPISLRGWIDRQALGSTDPLDDRLKLVRAKIQELYVRRMRSWRQPNIPSPNKESTIRDEIGRRARHLTTLSSMMSTLGRDGLDKSLKEHRLPGIEEVEIKVAQALDKTEHFPYGLIHGDLHSQNILLDTNDDIHLIDFAWAGYGWRALDYVMLECSLKFLVAPNDAASDDLLYMEELLEHEANYSGSFPELSDRICGSELQLIAAAIAEVRQQALALGAVSNFDQYRRGLIALSATLGTFPQLHRSFLAHSLAHHAKSI